LRAYPDAAARLTVAPEILRNLLREMEFIVPRSVDHSDNIDSGGIRSSRNLE
jgi:hypothetical protein